MSSGCHLVATGVAVTGEKSPLVQERILNQLRDADLNITVQKNQRDQEEGEGSSATSEQPELSAQGALALQWRGGAAQASWELRLGVKVGVFHN